MFLKHLASALAALLVFPAFLLYRLAAAIGGAERVFPGWSQAMSLLPGTTGVYLRRAFYRCVLPRVGRDALIGFGTTFSHATTRIGEKAYIGQYCVIGDATIEDEVLISSHVSITNGGRQHGIERLDIPIREQPGEWPHVTIGRDAWIGERAVIQADVGRHCVIGAGAVVTRPIPDFAIARGVPAKVVRFRNHADAASRRVEEQPEPLATSAE